MRSRKLLILLVLTGLAPRAGLEPATLLTANVVYLVGCLGFSSRLSCRFRGIGHAVPCSQSLMSRMDESRPGLYPRAPLKPLGCVLFCSGFGTIWDDILRRINRHAVRTGADLRATLTQPRGS